MKSGPGEERRPSLVQRLAGDVRRRKFPGWYRIRQEGWLVRGLVLSVLRRRRPDGREIHVFVIWSRALDAYGDILADIEQHFLIRNVFRVTWSKEAFSSSMTRFYGGLLPPNSEKEEHCGTDPFMVVVVEDERPRYGARRSPRGTVNVKMFDAKQRYRRWTGGGHRIHASVDAAEAEHDLFLLLGRRSADYLVMKERWTGEVGEVRELAGAAGWRDVDELLTAIEVATPSERLPPIPEDAAGLRMAVANRTRAVLTANARPHLGRLDSRLHDVTVGDAPMVVELLRNDRRSKAAITRLFGPTRAAASKLSAIPRGRRRPVGVILLYHRVADAEVDPFHLCVSPEHFEDQLKRLSDSWPIVELDSLVDGVASVSSLESPVLVITFDDGYADTIEVAQPIAAGLDAPISVFVTGDPIRTGEPFWWDELVALIWQPDDEARTVTVKIRGRLKLFSLANEEQRLRACLELHRALRDFDERERRLALDAIAAQLPERSLPGAGRPLTTEELKELGTRPGVTVGAHTMKHRALNSLLPAERTVELQDSKRFVQEVVGRRVDFFSYPFGRARDVGAEARRAVAQAGYRAACTTIQEPVRPGQSVYGLPRLTVADEPAEKLVARVAQLLAG